MNVVVDAQAWGFEHVPFNAAFVAALAEAYPGEPIHFFGERDHLGRCSGIWRRAWTRPRSPGGRSRCRRALRAARAGGARLPQLRPGAVGGAAPRRQPGHRLLPARHHRRARAQGVEPRRAADAAGVRAPRQPGAGDWQPPLPPAPVRLRTGASGRSCSASRSARRWSPRSRVCAEPVRIRHPVLLRARRPLRPTGRRPGEFSFLGLVEGSKGIRRFVDAEPRRFCRAPGRQGPLRSHRRQARGVPADDVAAAG